MAEKMLERWCQYLPNGKQILDTRIIAFKVPLKKEKLRPIDPKDWFTVKDLLEAVPNLGLVIDLCNTTKYYNSRELEAAGVKHKKVICVGGSVPSKSVVERFCTLIDDYLENDSTDKLIGVHCTHGINRTGYLVCRYLMTKLKMEPEEAIKVFEDARGHQIERPEFVEYLKKFKDPNFVDSDIRSNKFIPNRGRPGARPYDANRGPRGFPPHRRFSNTDFRDRDGPYQRPYSASSHRNYNSSNYRVRDSQHPRDFDEKRQRPAENMHRPDRGARRQFNSHRSNRDSNFEQFNSHRSGRGPNFEHFNSHRSGRDFNPSQFNSHRSDRDNCDQIQKSAVDFDWRAKR